MIHALLDHPWRLEENLYAPDALGVLSQFDNLVKTYGLTPLPFLAAADVHGIWNAPTKSALVRRGVVPNNIGRLVGLASPYICGEDQLCTASVLSTDNHFSLEWRRGLRDGLSDFGDLRTPKLIYRGTGRWAPDQIAVELQCDQCEDQDPIFVGPRSLINIESYSTHPHAADADPWKTLATRYPIPDGGGSHDPCFLPMPAGVEGTMDYEELTVALRRARSEPWPHRGLFAFVPPEDWNPVGGRHGAWRDGKAFRTAVRPDSSDKGPVDYLDRIWAWDEDERHWDVQLADGSHRRVTFDGRLA